MIPSDLAHWRSAQRAGEQTPWTDRVRFLDDGQEPAVLAFDDAGADADVVANVQTTRETAALVTWAAEDDERAYGYWRGPDDVALGEAPIVVLDTEWSYDLSYGTSLTEALCWELGQDVEEGYDGLVAQCRARGVEITVDDEDGYDEPDAAVLPGEHRDARYRELTSRS